MLIDILWNSETTQVDLADGTITVGGATTDGICLDGLPPALLTLIQAGEHLSVTARKAIRVGAAVFPSHLPRLLVAGEELKLPHRIILRRSVDAAAVAQRKEVDTAFVAEQLLGGGIEVSSTRAASFVCVTGPDQGRCFALPYETNTIGRADDAVVRVRDRSVSRQQAVLTRRGRTFTVAPAASMNAAYVNGRVLRKPTPLKTGDALELGQTVLRFDAGERAPEERTVLMSHAPALTPGAALPEEPPGPALLAAEPVAPYGAVAAPERYSAHTHELLMMLAGVGLALLGMALAALVL